MATKAYCVKCKAKREMRNEQQDHDEERQAGHRGQVPGVRHQDVQDRRLSQTCSSIGRSAARADAVGRAVLRARRGSMATGAASRR